MKCKIIKTMH